MSPKQINNLQKRNPVFKKRKIKNLLLNFNNKKNVTKTENMVKDITGLLMDIKDQVTINLEQKKNVHISKIRYQRWFKKKYIL